MSEAPKLRAGDDGDADGLVRLVAACYSEYPGCVLDVEREEPELLRPATAFDGFWVVESPAGIVGSVAFVLHGETAELKKLYLDPGLRGTGVAVRLEAEVVRAARRAGAGSMVLWSDTRFTRAHAFYEKRGWRRTGRTRDLGDLSRTTEAEFVKELAEGA
jgi:GNAT superfamily N-acetyltransferase